MNLFDYHTQASESRRSKMSSSILSAWLLGMFGCILCPGLNRLTKSTEWTLRKKSNPDDIGDTASPQKTRAKTQDEPGWNFCPRRNQCSAT